MLVRLHGGNTVWPQSCHSSSCLLFKMALLYPFVNSISYYILYSLANLSYFVSLVPWCKSSLDTNLIFQTVNPRIFLINHITFLSLTHVQCHCTGLCSNCVVCCVHLCPELATIEMAGGLPSNVPRDQPS